MNKVYEEISTVHERDFKRLLDHFGIYESFIKGSFKCKFCKEIITLENLHSVLPESGMVNFICCKPPCVQTLLEYMDNKKI